MILRHIVPTICKRRVLFFRCPRRCGRVTYLVWARAARLAVGSCAPSYSAACSAGAVPEARPRNDWPGVQGRRGWAFETKALPAPVRGAQHSVSLAACNTNNMVSYCPAITPDSPPNRRTGIQSAHPPRLELGQRPKASKRERRPSRRVKCCGVGLCGACAKVALLIGVTCSSQPPCPGCALSLWVYIGLRGCPDLAS